MEELNGSQARLPAPDFNEELKQAQSTGDFEFLLETAKKSHKMLVDFRDVIARAQFPGRDAQAVAMGLNFIENMISNSAGQISALKATEKATRDAMKAALKAQKNGADPEKPAEPAPAPEAPEQPTVPEPPAPTDPGV